ncbi:hypothetical protein [Diaminobutyricibacter sp. McL0608]|uniref:hypothetical protein n=1 Tax=Leifsonia sp. McL0608 TaxID=3143537 RepID=UPI0031F31BBF
MAFDFTAEVERILFREDPVGINNEVNVGEYMLEATEIVAELGNAESEQSLRSIIHDIFVWTFDETMAGPPEKYESIAHQIWELRGLAD